MMLQAVMLSSPVVLYVRYCKLYCSSFAAVDMILQAERLQLWRGIITHIHLPKDPSYSHCAPPHRLYEMGRASLDVLRHNVPSGAVLLTFGAVHKILQTLAVVR